MTFIQATEATAFIKNPALRGRAVARLVSGDAFLCPDCGNLTDAQTGCYPCDEARFTPQCDAYDAMQANTFDPYEYDLRNFCESRSEACAA